MLMGNQAQLAVGSGSFVPHVPLDDVAQKALAELGWNFTWSAPPYVCILCSFVKSFSFHFLFRFILNKFTLGAPSLRCSESTL
jgi:hypothetical protein